MPLAVVRRVFLRTLKVTLGTLLQLSGQPAAAQTLGDVRTYSLHCYCLGAYRSPQRVVALDNNGRLLALARTPKTRAAMEAHGLTVSDSQLRLLTDYRLLSRIGDTYRTNFTIVDPAQTAVLRTKARALAIQIAPSLQSDIARIRSLLQGEGLGDSLYAIVFGLGLDGTIWDSLKARGHLPDTTPDAAHPLWKGAFWAIAPQKPGAAGVNAVSFPGGSMFLAWTDRTSAALNRLSEDPAFKSAGAALATGTGKVSFTDVSGQSWTLADGRSLIPVVTRRSTDPIFEHSRRIGDQLARVLVDDPRGRALVRSIPTAAPSDGLLIAAHELVWAVDDALVESGSISRPRVLGGGEINPSTLRPFVFLVLD